MKIIVLSPHYDDAIYSCGGTLYDLVQDGHQVTIWTLMAGIPKPPLPQTPVLQDNHQRWEIGDNPVLVRRQEDHTAANIIGVETQYSPLLDCIYRTANGQALYPTEETLWNTIHPDDPAITALTPLEVDAVDLLYAPFGVGGHVDHLIVRNWGLQLAQQGRFTVKFYVEYPYLRDRSAVERARNHFPNTVTLEQQAFSERAMQRKVEAMAAYTSQIKSFWDNETQIDIEVRQTFTKNNQFVEEFAQAK